MIKHSQIARPWIHDIVPTCVQRGFPEPSVSERTMSQVAVRLANSSVNAMRSALEVEFNIANGAGAQQFCGGGSFLLEVPGLNTQVETDQD